MVEIVHKTDSTRSVWHSPEGLRNFTLDSSHWGIANRGYSWQPPMDVYETEDSIVVKVEVAGMGEADFNITLYGQLLAIRGIRTATHEKRAYHQMEIRCGEFNLEVELTNPINVGEITATYQDGFLQVVLPKSHPFQVKVED
jgi:HSP20 family protein